MSWSFRKKSRGEMNADPNEGEFFTPEGLTDALVRESIQNSLDARRDGEVVKVRFATGELPNNQAIEYLDGIWPHLSVLNGSRLNQLTPRSPMSYLVIEDFGTRGLCGPADQDDDDEHTESRYKDFFYFWRNIGRSRKQDTERGRWGLGKTVFPATSRINSFFGLTVRSEDGRAYLMGQSVLKFHAVGDDRYCPYGFFARLGTDDFQHPFDDPAIIDRFRNNFNLRRMSEPGLSVVVAFPDFEEVEPAKMVRSAILHYFYPILRGELVIDVSGQDVNVTIDAASIDQIAAAANWGDTAYTGHQLHRLFSFVRRSNQVAEAELLRLPEPSPARAPDWNVGRFTTDIIPAIKKQFADRQMLALRVPLTIRPKGGPDRATHFDVFIEHDRELSKAEDHYVRQGITISRIATLREKGFRGLVVVSHQALSTLLGDSENPSHTEWLEKATKLKDRYDWGPYTVRFVRQALQRIVAQLLYVPEGRDEQVLSNIFFLDDEAEAGPEPSRRKTTNKPEPVDATPPDPPPSTNGSPYSIQKISGGFRITRNDHETERPHAIAVEVAYEVRRGNAFKKYEKYDFDLKSKPICLTPVGAIVSVDANVLRIEPTTDQFLVEVTGFDPHRDLAIRGKTLKPEVADAQEV
jgi:hypothetical protein